MGNINIVIMLLENIKMEEWSFVSKWFFGSSLNDAGISFQILAPTLSVFLSVFSHLSTKIRNLSARFLRTKSLVP